MRLKNCQFTYTFVYLSSYAKGNAVVELLEQMGYGAEKS